MNVERDSPEKNMIGTTRARCSRRFGTEARKELEAILGSKIYLGLFVESRAGLAGNPQKVRELDWRYQLEGLASELDEKK